jgi:hypothetical protein
LMRASCFGILPPVRLLRMVTYACFCGRSESWTKPSGLRRSSPRRVLSCS